MDKATWAQINGEYAMPLDAGPAWRAAHAAGIDMSLIEESLNLTPEQRLAEHQQVINFLDEVRQAGSAHDALIASKRAVARERDLAAVRQLLAIQERQTS